MSLTAGSKLGPYEVIGQIGAGGMGEVYRARDPRLGREVAIKVLPPSFSADPERLRRFEQEARAAGILNHPNITAVYDIGQHDGAPYVVQELLEGDTLRSLLAGGRFSMRKTIDTSLQIAHGLSAAHEKGIVHRDLKPENLFVTRDGRVKILDFGLAKLTHAEEGGSQQTNLPTATAGTEPGVVLGTLGYMSPEQVRGRQADARSDIFSFGAILYEMLSGKRAFQGDSAADTMSAILKEDPPDLSVTNQAVSPGLERIVRHCLEKNPEQRFHSAHDLAFDLEALSGTSGQAPLAGSGSAARPLPSSRFLVAAAAVLVAGAAFGFFAGRRTGRAPATPMFHRLTFRRGFINSARFAPDGQTIAYGAAWDGKPLEVFSTRAGAAESRSLGLPKGDVLSISSSGEMAILLRRPAGVSDMLARVSLAGGTPRDVLEDVVDADWSPDGKSLAVIRAARGAPRTLEFPIGKVLLSSPSLYEVRIAPDGKTLAVHGGDPTGSSISFVDPAGKTRKLASGLNGGGGLAWSVDGREIWFTQATREGPPSLIAVDLVGRTRSVLRIPSWLWLQDIARDGRVLATNNGWRAGLNWLRPGDAKEQDVSWLDWSIASALSADGRTLLFSEEREGGGTANGTVFLRRSSAEPPVRLGDGSGLALSPDGKWALASVIPAGAAPRLQLLPTGAGEPRTLPTGAVSEFFAAAWLDDGKRFILRGREAGHRDRLYLFDLAGAAPRAITVDGASGPVAASPNGQMVVSRVDAKIELVPIEKGEPRALPGQVDGDLPIQWSADGRSIYVYQPGEPTARVFRVDIETGKRDLWKEIAPADPAGIEQVGPILVTPDAKSYLYTYQRRSSDLFIVEGVK